MDVIFSNFSLIQGLDSRTKRIFSDVRVNIPYETIIDFLAVHGEEGEKDIEKSAGDMAKNIAEKVPE